MKIRDAVRLIILVCAAIALIAFPPFAREGALQGLSLAQATVIPSLLPLLIIFYLIMNTGSKDLLAKAFGITSVKLFNLPQITFPALLFGLIGGYPTGALLTSKLFENEEIDAEQAKRMMRFNFCGGCGFIITALGSGVLGSTKVGIIIFISNIIAETLLGFVLSFTKKRNSVTFYSYTEKSDIADALINSTQSAVKAVLNLTAFIVLFCALQNIVTIPKEIVPLIEITSGVCSQNTYSPQALSAYLAFGGLCVHFQIMPLLAKIKMKYCDFFAFRVIAAVLSYIITKILIKFIPIQIPVFSNSAGAVADLSGPNALLSVLMAAGCFVLILDINSRKKLI